MIRATCISQVKLHISNPGEAKVAVRLLKHTFQLSSWNVTVQRLHYVEREAVGWIAIGTQLPTIGAIEH